MTYRFAPTLEMIILFVCALLLLPMAWQYAIDRFAPMERWVRYDAVEPVNDTLLLGEPLYMCSYRSINKTPINLEFVDGLRCKIRGKVVALQPAFWPASYSRTDDHTEECIMWKFGGQLPAEPAECYMTSAITLVKPFARRTTVIESGMITFTDGKGGGR